MNLDMQTLIHVGTELVIIGGISFWLNRRIGAIDSKCEDLLKKIAAYEDIISQQQALLQRHEQIFQRILGPQYPGGQQQMLPQGSQQGSQQGSPQGPPQNQVQPRPLQQKAPPQAAQAPSPVPQAQPSQNNSDDEKSEGPDLSASQLDIMLQQELGDIDLGKNVSQKKTKVLKSGGTKTVTASGSKKKRNVKSSSPPTPEPQVEIVFE